MDFQTTAAATETIMKVCRSSDLLTELKDDFLSSATRYARIRVDWHLSDRDVRTDMDDMRSRSHDAFIDACNALSRTMVTEGLEISWREKLGVDRKVIGDFACYIHAYLGILAR